MATEEIPAKHPKWLEAILSHQKMLLSRLDAIEAAKRKDSELKKAKESKAKSEKAKKSKSEEKDSKSNQEPLWEDEEKPSPKGERKAKSSYESDRSSFKSKSDCGSSHEHEERKKKAQEQEKTAQESVRDPSCGRTRKQFKSQVSYSRAGCGWCGFWKRHDKNHCRASDKTCYSCHMTGHFARVCRNRGRSSRPKVQGQEGQQGQGRRGRWNFNRAQNVSNSESNWRWQGNEVKVNKGQKRTFPDAVKKKTSYTEAVKKKTSYTEAVKKKTSY